MKNIRKKLYKLQENFYYFKLSKRKLYAMLIEAKDNRYKNKERKSIKDKERRMAPLLYLLSFPFVR